MPIEKEAGWAPETIWTFWTGELSLVTLGTRTAGRLALSLVATTDDTMGKGQAVPLQARDAQRVPGS